MTFQDDIHSCAEGKNKEYVFSTQGVRYDIGLVPESVSLLSVTIHGIESFIQLSICFRTYAILASLITKAKYILLQLIWKLWNNFQAFRCQSCQMLSMLALIKQSSWAQFLDITVVRVAMCNGFWRLNLIFKSGERDSSVV